MTPAEQIDHLQRLLDDARQSLATARALCGKLTAENASMSAQLAAARAAAGPAPWRNCVRRHDSCGGPQA